MYATFGYRRRRLMQLHKIILNRSYANNNSSLQYFETKHNSACNKNPAFTGYTLLPSPFTFDKTNRP